MVREVFAEEEKESDTESRASVGDKSSKHSEMSNTCIIVRTQHRQTTQAMSDIEHVCTKYNVGIYT